MQAPKSERPVFPRRLSLPGRVLYAVRHSLPFATNGYAVRTHGVARALSQSGCEVLVCTAPGLPWNQPGQGDRDWSNHHSIDGVRYIHTPHFSTTERSPKECHQRLVQTYAELIRVFKPAVVMAASNWANALPPAAAARASNLPFLYEVRGFWELTRLAREPAWEGSPDYRQARMMEQDVVRRAQRLFTLNRFMRDELAQRGVPAERIDLVPNGFDGWAPAPDGSDGLRRQLGVKARHVVGYIGSFNAYEGLEDLIGAVARLRAQGLDLALMLVGSSSRMGMEDQTDSGLCPAGQAYQALAKQLGISKHLYLPGRIKPAAVADYYGLLDLVVIPRRPLPVCELVSPLKPLEAAAHDKRVLMSDVAPLAELRSRCSNFFYFKKGQPDTMAEQMQNILSNHADPPTRCHSLEDLTWCENVRPMVRAINACGGNFVLERSTCV